MLCHGILLSDDETSAELVLPMFLGRIPVLANQVVGGAVIGDLDARAGHESLFRAATALRTSRRVLVLIGARR